MNNSLAELDRLIERLHERGRVRVWSLVVTVFGDAIVPRGGQVSLQVLQSLMERLAIEPGALRTALSRLASDGWVLRQKDGRNSFYRLAPEGRHAFDEATQRIYAVSPPKWDGRWTVAIRPGGGDDAADELASAGFAHQGSGVWLRAETEASVPLKPPPESMLVIEGNSAELPPNVSALWDTRDTAKAFAEFRSAFDPLARALQSGGALEPMDALAARTLLIHDWRRIILRAPKLPAELQPSDWPGGEARNLAKRIYARLAPASEAWLDENGLPPVVDMAGFAGRFGIVERIRVEDV